MNNGYLYITSASLDYYHYDGKKLMGIFMIVCRRKREKKVHYSNIIMKLPNRM